VPYDAVLSGRKATRARGRVNHENNAIPASAEPGAVSKTLHVPHRLFVYGPTGKNLTSGPTQQAE